MIEGIIVSELLKSPEDIIAEACFFGSRVLPYIFMSYKYVPIIVVIVAVFLAFFVYPTAFDKSADFLNSKLHFKGAGFEIPHFFKVPSFRLGLDLLGGTRLVYQADLSGIAGGSVADAMAGVRDVIERRVNLFGVTEPLVQIEGNDRLAVELAGIKDINQAIQLIGLTPFLEFKEQRAQDETQKILDAQKKGQQLDEDPYFKSTGLTGKQLQRSQLTFDQTTGRPQVSLELNSDGAKLFADITKRNLNKIVAIYVDGQPISTPGSTVGNSQRPSRHFGQVFSPRSQTFSKPPECRRPSGAD